MKILGTKPGRVAALVALALYLLPGFALADEMVLCVAEDGSVSFEEAREGRCVNSHDEPCGEASGRDDEECPSSPDDCCGSCLDLPVSIGSRHDHKVPAAGGPTDFGSSPECLPVAAGAPADESPVTAADSPGIIPVARSALKILRSTVIIV